MTHITKVILGIYSYSIWFDIFNQLVNWSIYFRTDTFTVTGPRTGQNTPPTICGVNTMEHSTLTFNSYSFSAEA